MIGGTAGGCAALTIGLFNSIMFLVISTLALERSTTSQEVASGFVRFSMSDGARPLGGH